MWLQFFLEDAHFVVNMLMFLALVGICWLYFDAWTVNKNNSQLVRIFGFFLLAVSFFIQATRIEFSFSSVTTVGRDLMFFLPFARCLGYVLIIISLIREPLIDRPKHFKTSAFIISSFSLTGLINIFDSQTMMIFYPILAVFIFVLYLRRATVGLEDHLKPLTLGFLAITVAELFSLSGLFRNTNNVDLFNLVASFGPLWIIENLFLALAVFIFFRWVFGYLLKRFQSQMFIILTSMIMVVFFLITILYTGLLFKNFTNEALNQLRTNAKIFELAIESKKNETINIGQLIAGNDQVKKGILKEDDKLQNVIEDYLISKKQTTITLISATGQVLARGEDGDKKGDSLSEDVLVKTALDGGESSTIVVRDNGIIPGVYIMSATPIKDQEKIIGAVISGVILDSAFIDGVKKSTGLEASIYAHKQLSASTIVSPDGKSRLLGIEEVDDKILSMVLKQGDDYGGETSAQGTPYLSVFLPLKDKSDNIVGMLSISQQMAQSFETIAYSMELTFIIIAFLLVLSIFPSYFIARYIEYQLK